MDVIGRGLSTLKSEQAEFMIRTLHTVDAQGKCFSAQRHDNRPLQVFKVTISERDDIR